MLGMETREKQKDGPVIQFNFWVDGITGIIYTKYEKNVNWEFLVLRFNKKTKSLGLTFK